MSDGGADKSDDRSGDPRLGTGKPLAGTEAVSDDRRFAPGKAFPVWETAVTAERQDYCHRACDIGGARYGEMADVAILSHDCMRTLKRAKLPIDGLIYSAYHVKQIAPVKLGERLAVTGKITAVEMEPRGNAISAEFEFTRGDEVAVTMKSVILRPNPASTGRRVSAGTEDGQADQAPAEFRLSTRKLITPDRVTEFSKDAGNKIHTDPGFAARFGYRAPVADSLMTVSYIIEAISVDGVPDQLEIETKFVSPVYWDDGLDIMVRPGSSGETGRTIVVRCVNPRGVLTCEANIQI